MLRWVRLRRYIVRQQTIQYLGCEPPRSSPTIWCGPWRIVCVHQRWSGPTWWSRTDAPSTALPPMRIAFPNITRVGFENQSSSTLYAELNDEHVAGTPDRHAEIHIAADNHHLLLSGVVC